MKKSTIKKMRLRKHLIKRAVGRGDYGGGFLTRAGIVPSRFKELTYPKKRK